ncbi:MAG: serine/threonine protein kinase [bacterium]|nr:serine/threonine protein kinase [bacterium]
MNNEFIQQAMDVFLAAVELHGVEQRAFVARECGDDEPLRARVEELLRHAADDGAVGLATAASEASRAASAGIELGDFVLREKLGHGGMGVVWLAQQKSLDREVALKLVRPSLVTPELLKRLEREAAILGRLQHPGIASVYAVGRAPVGGVGLADEQHFFAMEYVQGEPIDTFVERHGVDIDGRLELLAKIGDAVAHAHDKGVVHRDLKPDNILVTADGVPKVLDFGIARATSSDVMTMTMQTAVGQVVGTVPYMSPEQVLGDSSQIDARSDVYSLGALLYKLLSGRLPAEVSGRSMPEAARIIRDDEPTRIGTIATSLRGDIETIVHKALEKDRAGRYQSAGALAADIRRFLAHEPIVARPTTTLYQVRKFARRHKGLVGGLVATFVVLVMGVAVSLMLAIEANRSAAAVERTAYSQGLFIASNALEDHEVAVAEKALLRVPERLRGWEWHHLASRLDMSLLVLPLPAGATNYASPPWFSDDDRVLSMWVRYFDAEIEGRERCVVARWALPSGEPLEPGAVIEGLAWSDVAVARPEAGWGRREGDVFTWFGSTAGESVRIPWADFEVRGEHAGNIHVTPGGTHVAWNVVPPDAEAEPSRALAGWETWFAQVTPTGLANARKIGPGLPELLADDGRHVVMRVNDLGGTLIWSAAGGTVELNGHTDLVRAFASSADWSVLATTSYDGTVRLWDVATGQLVASTESRGSRVSSCVITADGQTVVSADKSGLLRIWNGRELDPGPVLHGHRDKETSLLAWSEDESMLASAMYLSNRVVRVWDANTRADPWQLTGHDSYVYALAVSPDGGLVASGSWDNMVRLWNTRTLEEVRTLAEHDDHLVDVAFSPDGRTLASVDRRQHMVLWDVASGAREAVVPGYELDARTPITWHPDGARLLVAMSDDEVRLFDRRDGRTVTAPITLLQEFRSGIVSGDGTRFVRAEHVSLWPVQKDYCWLALCATDTGRELARVRAGNNYLKIAFSPVGAGPLRLLTPLEHRQGAEVEFGWCLLDATTGARLAEHAAGLSLTMAVAFSPDGTRFMTAGYENSISVWDAETFDELVRLNGHTDYVYRLAFGPDGKRLYSASGDHSVRVWGTKPLSEVLMARRRQ